MTNPICPQDYTCTFTRLHPRTVIEHVGPWWHTWMLPALIFVVVAATTWLIFVVFSAVVTGARSRRIENAQAAREEAKRRHELAIEEQRTLQMNEAHGDPEALKLMREILR